MPRARKRKSAAAKPQAAVEMQVAEVVAEKQPENDQGPPVYLNWLWSLKGKPLLGTQEFPLYTDARIVAETKHGPYEFLNTVSAMPGVVRPAVILRYELY